MGFLASVGPVIRKWMFAPVEKLWSDPSPDHQAYIRPDYSICCEWHQEHSFRVNPESTERLTEATDTRHKRAYITERLGHSPR